MKLQAAFIGAVVAGIALLSAGSSARADDVDDIEKIQKEVQQQLEQAFQELNCALQQAGQQVPGGIPNIQMRGVNNRRPGGPTEDARLGSAIEKPSSVITDQLDLPKGQGMVLSNVKADSAAAKAGLKTNDILLEINGKGVPSDEAEYYKLINDIKPGAAVDAVVLRKGKKETVKGVTLPEGKADAGVPGLRLVPRNGGGNNVPGVIVPNIQGLRLQLQGLQGLPGQPGARAIPGARGGIGNGMTIERKADGSWTSKYAEADMAITISAKTAEGKTEVTEIEIKDGETTKKYGSFDAVPEKFRADVQTMIRRSEVTLSR
jgi:membrane-associated protease RseP (regulator of RpoE activity)